MKKPTEDAIKALLTADHTVAPQVAEAMIRVGRGDVTAPAADIVESVRERTDEPMTGKEVAEALKVTRRTVLNLVNRGVIRRIGNTKNGTRTRYSRRSVEEFLNGEGVAA